MNIILKFSAIPSKNNSASVSKFEFESSDGKRILPMTSSYMAKISVPPPSIYAASSAS